VPRAGLTTAIVTESAARIADDVGLQSLTLAAVAQQLGVRLPSLYKHIDGTNGLHREIAVRAKTELADVLRRAAVGRTRGEALRAVAAAYRSWAARHPGQYQATVRAAAPGDAADHEAGLAAAGVVFDVLTGYRLHGDDAVDATRALRAALHGFVTLESEGGFGLPADVDRSFDRLVSALIVAMEHWLDPAVAPS
jgi:AcrR family transcriptional regulator